MIHYCRDCGEEIGLDDDCYPYCFDCEEELAAGQFEDGDDEDWDPLEESAFDLHFGSGYNWELK